MIHPTAVVHPGAHLGVGVCVGAFSIVEEGAVLEDSVELAEHAVVRSGASIGAGCRVDSFCTVGGLPQMRGDAAPTGSVRVGARSVLREGVTISRPTRDDGVTHVGEDCMLMANSHVGHDCAVGDEVTLANNVMLAGHVLVGAGTFLGGGAGVHQFVRVGARAMVGGNASMSYDVPPFSMAAERNEIRGLNFVGLRRAKMAADELRDLKRAYHAVYAGPGDFRARAQAAIEAGECGVEPAGRDFLSFFVGGERGFARPRSCGTAAGRR